MGTTLLMHCSHKHKLVAKKVNLSNRDCLNVFRQSMTTDFIFVTNRIGLTGCSDSCLDSRKRAIGRMATDRICSSSCEKKIQAVFPAVVIWQVDPFSRIVLSHIHRKVELKSKVVMRHLISTSF